MTNTSFVKNFSLCVLAALATSIAGFSQEEAKIRTKKILPDSQQAPAPLPNEHTETGTKSTTHRPSNFYGEWYCDGIKTDIYRFLADKTARHRNDNGAWRVSNGVLTVLWENGYRLTIDIRQTGSTVLGNSFPPGRDQPDHLRFTKVGHEPTDPSPAIQ